MDACGGGGGSLLKIYVVENILKMKLFRFKIAVTL